MTKINLRWAKRSDLERFYGAKRNHLPTVRALVGEAEGRILGIGGIARIDGRRIAFCDVTKEGRRYKVAIAKAAKMIMADVRKKAASESSSMSVVATIDPQETGAERWLVSLGFRPVPKKKGTYRWRV